MSAEHRLSWRQVEETAQLFVGLALAGIALFYWSVEGQDMVSPYYPFGPAARLVYGAIGFVAVGLTAWTVFGRGPGRTPLLNGVEITLRFFLAFQMLRYGMVKIIPLQFTPWLYWDDLLGRDLGAFDRAWMFFSYSRLYGLFLGGFEIVAALLLLIRRTFLVGALMAAGILINIALVNLEYDVPILWDAFLYTMIALFLVGMRLEVLINLVWRWGTRARSSRHQVVGTMAAFTLIGYVSAEAYSARYASPWFSPVYGVWDVDEDETRVGQQNGSRLGFDRVYFEEGSYVHVRSSEGKVTDLWTTYSVRDDSLTTKHPRFSFRGRFRLENDILVLVGLLADDTESRLVLHRVSRDTTGRGQVPRRRIVRGDGDNL